MARPKLPKAYLWREREIKDWNTDTFLAYIKEKHETVLDLPYVYPKGGVMVEKGMINKFRQTHGNETTREFIDKCFETYKPSPNYPNLTFSFMKSYMESYNLPRVLVERRKETQAKAYETKTGGLTTDEMLELL